MPRRMFFKALWAWTFRLLVVVMTLLSLAVVILWVRSRSRIETWEWTWRSNACLVEYTAGVILISRVTGSDETDWSVHRIQSYPRADPTHFQTTWRILGVSPAGFSLYVSPSGRSRIVVVPFWFLFTLTATIPAIGLGLGARAWRRRHAVVPGHCIQCGYDLRATPDRCPECGTVNEANPSGARSS